MSLGSSNKDLGQWNCLTINPHRELSKAFSKSSIIKILHLVLRDDLFQASAVYSLFDIDKDQTQPSSCVWEPPPYAALAEERLTSSTLEVDVAKYNHYRPGIESEDTEYAIDDATTAFVFKDGLFREQTSCLSETRVE